MSVTLSDDGATAQLNFLPASGMEGRIELTLDQLTSLIQALATARARMMSGQAVTPLEAASVQAIVNPPWRVQPEALTEGSMLAFHHPGFGALGFVLKAADVERMVRALTTHLGMVHTQENAAGKPKLTCRPLSPAQDVRACLAPLLARSSPSRASGAAGRQAAGRRRSTSWARRTATVSIA